MTHERTHGHRHDEPAQDAPAARPTPPTPDPPAADRPWDVVVAGGGPAGLAAALVLSRARRRVLVVDAGAPRNAPAAHAHGFLTRDGAAPRALLAHGRDEVLGYGGEVLPGRVTAVEGELGAFVVTLEGGTRLAARAVVSATGGRDALPDVPGLAQRWGRDVLHCPYCHGWEVGDGRVVVAAEGPLGVHAALLWRQWTPRVTLLRPDAALPADEAARLAARGVRVALGRLAGLVVTDDRLTGVRSDAGETLAADALVVRTLLEADDEHLAPLGLRAEPVEHAGVVVARAVPTDAWGGTGVPGVRVAGNVSDPAATVLVSAAQGATVAGMLNAELVELDAREAVGRWRGLTSGPDATSAWSLDAHGWEERYGTAPAVWSGQPNAALVAQTAHLTPGTALDLGAGEGRDAVWLAQRGWRVTAVDFAATALERGARAAQQAGVDVRWVQADLATPDERALDGGSTFDLVTSHFLHLAPQARRGHVARAARLVAPGGTLLLVQHHALDLAAPVGLPDDPSMFPGADEVRDELLALDAAWTVEVALAVPRHATTREGETVTVHDAVLRARRA
ncbi:bifunctional NAD(P)/FAD-dependent oxidoreductase/class I SAM-dependent methyltransferase [Cellulomonas uda]|uniref:Methyltransferase n=1 Tax=Cellulomonas uda TaxID=1714 RepID=A0A4Y3KBU8_CELUD|nr:bifunctional NAD(P)/FAD-dependent oxidoreductase/class I SAM-dependent methyltransferase [Cellulomonas uda]NII65470.1 thioredoxin reductase/SAM-dependent methyltransferase [Cellulomonas uda]GEA81166.1 methyltransferase [Cellulomonas uda]